MALVSLIHTFALTTASNVQYLTDPEGKFLTFYGKNFTAEQMIDSICDHINQWKASHPVYASKRQQS